MMQGKMLIAGSITALLLTIAGCALRSPTPDSVEPVRPLSADEWAEIKEQIWTASALAQSEAESQARQAMQAWMARVREKSEKEFVPWYSAYWTQQWIGFKTGWYEMGKEEDEPPVKDYLVEYLQERFNELVLEPAAVEGSPQTITEQAAAHYILLLSEQLQCLPKMHAVPLLSLQKKLEWIPLIAPSGKPPSSAPLSLVMQQTDLAGTPAYDVLIGHADSVDSPENTTPNETRLQRVAEDTVARLVAELPVRAGGGSAALVVGEALGLFISAGVSVWSAISHNQARPEIESQLRVALDAGLEDIWQTLMDDPQQGVMFPVNHMNQQIELGLFPTDRPELVLPF